MNTDTIAGIVVLVTGVVVSIFVFFCLRRFSTQNGALRVAAMACGATLTVGALLPQAIRNSTDPDGFVEGFSPFLLLLFPLAILLKLMPDISVLHTLSIQRKNGDNSDAYWIVKLQVASLFFIVVLYTTFCGQYGAAADPALKPVFILFTIIYALTTMFIAFVAIDENWRADFARLWES